MVSLSALKRLQARFNKRILKKHEKKSNTPIVIMPRGEGAGRLGNFNNFGIGRKCPKRRK